MDKEEKSIKNQIITYLQWKLEEYDEKLLQTYWSWCRIYGKYPSIIQQLFANSQISNWFMIEYTKCELQFLKLAKNISRKTQTLRRYYQVCVLEIMELYPKKMLNGFNRNKSFSVILKTNTPIYYAN